MFWMDPYTDPPIIPLLLSLPSRRRQNLLSRVRSAMHDAWRSLAQRSSALRLNMGRPSTSTAPTSSSGGLKATESASWNRGKSLLPSRRLLKTGLSL